MLLKTMVAVTLLTGLLKAAGPNDSEFFKLTPPIKPQRDLKNRMDQFLATKDNLKFLTQSLKDAGKCAIPLLEGKHAKTNDAIGMAVGPAHESPSVVPPPVPACKNWPH